MKTHLEKIGSFGGIIAAAACPVCFPKLALLGAVFGLAALGAYESELLIAAQVLIAIAVIGHMLAYRRHRKRWLLGLGVLSGAAVFVGLYLLSSEVMVYAGFAGLVATSATGYWTRFRKTQRPSMRNLPAKAESGQGSIGTGNGVGDKLPDVRS
jgi:mercuric ion transport protein